MKSSDCGFNLPNLPDEVWAKVFSYLPVNDRKSVKLSCSRFYQISSDVDFQKIEKMTFYGNLNTVEALQSFASSERRIWNLELNAVHLMDDSILSFFQHQGPKVRSLKFSNCVMAAGVFRSIIEHCENLCSLTLVFPAYIEPYVKMWSMDRRESDFIFSDFEHLHKAGVIRQNVTNFSFNLCYWQLSRTYLLTNKKFLDIFTIFPNIKELDLVICPDLSIDELNPLSSDIISDSKFSFSCIYHQLYKMRNQLERLTLSYFYFHLHNSNSILTFNKISHIEMNNLKKLSIDYAYKGNISVILPQFEYLTHLHCYVTYVDSNSPIIQRILHTAKQLHSLIIDVHSDFHMQNSILCNKCVK